MCMCAYTLAKWGKLVGDSMCPSCPEVLHPQDNTCHTHTLQEDYTNTHSPLNRKATDMQVKCVTCDWAVRASEWWAPAATLNTSLPFRLFTQTGCSLERKRKRNRYIRFLRDATNEAVLVLAEHIKFKALDSYVIHELLGKTGALRANPDDGKTLTWEGGHHVQALLPGLGPSSTLLSAKKAGGHRPQVCLLEWAGWPVHGGGSFAAKDEETLRE